MPDFYVQKNAQANGDHEVHNAYCTPKVKQTVAE